MSQQHPDYQLRSWAIDFSLRLNEQNSNETTVDKVISDAEKIYGFMFPKNGEIKQIKEKNKHEPA